MPMKVLFILRQAPGNLLLHKKVTDLLSLITKEQTLEDSAVFFTDDAVSISSKGIGQLPEHKEIQEAYLKVSLENSISLLVCGRAFKDKGLEKEQVQEGFSLSGNFELTTYIATADKVIEF